MIKYFSILLLSLFIPALATAQHTTENKKAAKSYQSAKDHFTFHRYQQAERELEKAIKADPRFVEAYYLLAGVYRGTGDIDKSLESLQRCAEINGSSYPMIFFYWGTELLELGRYQEARDKLLILKSQSQLLRANQREMLDFALRRAEFALYQIANPVPFAPTNMGSNINTENDDYHPALSADESMFVVTSNLPTQSEAFGKGFQEDFFISFRTGGVWGPRQAFGPPINTPLNEGTLSMTADGSVFFFSACNRHDGYGSCDIYYTRRVGSNWGKPQNIGPPINTRYWEAQPSVTADGRTIYFVSNRPGGYGGADIWVSHLDQFGEWSEPRNLGPNINTAKNENNPFIHADNHTFYFCSEGHLGMGASDIYITRKNNEGEWMQPQNLGYPINTHANETGILVSAQGNKAYFASDALGGLGGMDIYEFSLHDSIRPKPVSYVTGIVHDKNTGKSLSSIIELIDIETSYLVAQSFSDPVTGKYLVVLPSGRKYVFNASRSGYLFFSQSFNVPAGQEEAMQMDIPLSPIASGVKMVLNNVFFDTDSYHLINESKIELDRLIQFMRENPRVKIEIGGHTDNRGGLAANMILSEYRAKAVHDYIISQNIDPGRMSFKGYGPEQHVAPNDTDANRARNRRTEIKIVEH
jgi:outer membrane protein OmpA-like peptidoglycan-associated protein